MEISLLVNLYDFTTVKSYRYYHFLKEAVKTVF